jgi:hypothetical protein
VSAYNLQWAVLCGTLGIGEECIDSCSGKAWMKGKTWEELDVDERTVFK